MNTYQTLIQFASALSVALKARDPYTRFHSDRVMNLSMEIGTRIALPSDQLTLLRAAAALHDIGKIGIPDEVLLKTGKLDDAERALIQTHSARGAEIVGALDREGADVVAEAIRHHHEDFDGGGYPHGLAGEQIPLLSRIITIADNYDAMATRRIYQEPRKHHAIIDEMLLERGRKHDPDLFELFIQLIEKSPFRAP